MTITIYRNILHYEQLLRLFQCLSNVEYLTVLFAIGATGTRPGHSMGGLDLQRDIISHMPHLRQLNLSIWSISRNAPRVDIDTSEFCQTTTVARA